MHSLVKFSRIKKKPNEKAFRQRKSIINYIALEWKTGFTTLVPIDWRWLPKALCWEGPSGFIHVPMSIMSTTEGMMPAHTLCTSGGHWSHRNMALNPTPGSSSPSNVNLSEINLSASNVSDGVTYAWPHLDSWALTQGLKGWDFPHFLHEAALCPEAWNCSSV